MMVSRLLFWGNLVVQVYVVLQVYVVTLVVPHSFCSLQYSRV